MPTPFPTPFPQMSIPSPVKHISIVRALLAPVIALSTAAQASDEDAINEQFVALEQQLMLLADFRKTELKKIKVYTRQLEKIANDCSLEKAAPYRDFLAGREKDFQIFLGSVKSGTTSLAGMIKGSRQWLTAHNRELDELKQLSIARQNKINDLSALPGVK